jgi:hypothetical protein
MHGMNIKTHFLLSMRRICTCTYSRITSRKPLSYCVTSFGTSVTNLTSLLSQHDYCTCYINRRVLAPPQLCLKKIIVHAVPICDISVNSVTLPTPEAGHFVVLILLCTWSTRCRYLVCSTGILRCLNVSSTAS